MTKSHEKLIQIYLHTTNYFSLGVLAFVLIKTIREEYQRSQETKDDIFLGTVIISTYNSMILTLANTIKPNKDSIHLFYLLSYIKDSKDLFDTKTYDQLVNFISEVETELDKISHITDSVIKLRNTTVAHLDRKHVNNPLILLQNPPIKWSDMELAYTIIGSGLMEIGKYLDLDFQDIITISNFELAKKTRKVYRTMYGEDKVS